MADGADVAYSFPMLNSKKIVGYLGDNNILVSEQASDDTNKDSKQHLYVNLPRAVVPCRKAVPGTTAVSCFYVR